MPAFGAYAGGLNVRDRAFAQVFGTLAFTAHMLGERRLYALAAERCLADCTTAQGHQSRRNSDRREPAGDRRHHRGGEPVEQAVVARRVGDELLEADLDDLERGAGARAIMAPSANSLTSTS